MDEKDKDQINYSKLSVYIIEGLMISYVLYLLYTSSSWAIGF
jgi:hypothetical protein